LAVVVGVLGLLACAGGVASADTTSDVQVVNVTVYSASGESGPTGVTLGDLNGCPSSPTPDTQTADGLYGANGVYTGQNFSPSEYVYSINAVLTCGLGPMAIPIRDVTSVQVVNPQYGLEENGGVLNTGDLDDPPAQGSFDNSQAEPEISADPDGNVSYFRPWRGGTDDNVADAIYPDGEPISIEVYESGIVLTVHASYQINSGLNVTFSATVTAPDGSTISPSALNWTWNFGDGTGTSSAATPTHNFAVAGNYPVTVNVYDPSNGGAGSANDAVDFPGQTSTSTTPQNGSGSTTPINGAPSGPQKSAGGNPSKSPGATKTPSPSNTSHHGKHTSTAHARTKKRKPARHHHKATATPAPTPTPSGTGGSGPSSSARNPNAPNDKSLTSKNSTGYSTSPTKPTAHPKNANIRVAGRLISDVITLPADESPLVHAVSTAVGSAPVVLRATRPEADLFAIIAAVLTVLLLFTFGVGRELRWRRDWRALGVGA
jgi:hypothetical protein